MKQYRIQFFCTNKGSTTPYQILFEDLASIDLPAIGDFIEVTRKKGNSSKTIRGKVSSVVREYFHDDVTTFDGHGLSVRVVMIDCFDIPISTFTKEKTSAD